MIALNLTAKGAEQEIVKKYLEENASEVLADKINNGVRIEKDGKTLISRKTLDGFMKYANEEARKQAEKGATSACIIGDVVFGWAVHYFEEDSIEGTLYNEDGTEYKAPRPAKTATKTTVKTTPPIKKEEPKLGQLSLFDVAEEEPTEEVVEEAEDSIGEIEAEPVIEEKAEPEKPKVSPFVERYRSFKSQYPDYIIAFRIGDFYEIFGDDAKQVASVLDLTLVGRDVGLEEKLPMVGYPYHKEDVYRGKLQKTFDVVVVENDTDVKFYNKIEEDKPSYAVDVKTGELIEDSAVNGDDYKFELGKGVVLADVRMLPLWQPALW